MLSDEEKAKDILINFRKYNKYYKEEKALSITISFELKEALNEAIKVLLTVYEKQSKEIEELNKENTRQHELIGNIHKKWKDKIKAKVIEIKDRPVQDEFITASQGKLNTIIDMESLLEKE